MSRTLLLRFTFIVALLAFPATLRADQIGVVPLSFQMGVRIIADQVRFTIELGPEASAPPLITVFDVVVGSANAGQTFSLSSGPVFEAAVSYLTNGVNGTVGHFYSFDINDPGGNGAAVNESLFFFGDPTGSGRVDFAGFEITSLELRIDEIIFSSPGTNPSGDGLWTDFNIRSTLTVNGQPAAVPEPATLCLMGLGLAGIYARRRTRAGRSAPPVSGK
jgi:hypothetical protein